MTEVPAAERLLTPAEAAAELKVDRAALGRMAVKRKLAVVRTLGGHRRYREEDIAVLREEQEEREQMLTTAEVAALLRVSERAVGRWVKAGRLTPVLVRGRQYLFRRDEVVPPGRGEGGGT